MSLTANGIELTQRHEIRLDFLSETAACFANTVAVY